MIDDLANRVALTFAALLLLGTGTAVLRLSQGDAVREAAQDLADHVASQLDALGRVDAQFVLRAGTLEDGPLALPTSVGGIRYRLEVRPREVWVVAGDVLAAAPLQEPVHPFAPDRDAYAQETLDALDSASCVVLEVGQTMLVERAMRLVDLEPVRLTFVHLPR